MREVSGPIISEEGREEIRKEMQQKIDLGNSEYMEIQGKILLIGKSLTVLDLDSFLGKISRAEAVAPIVDPTLYRKAAENLLAIKNLAEALNNAKHKFDELQMLLLENMLKGEQ